MNQIQKNNLELEKRNISSSTDRLQHDIVIIRGFAFYVKDIKDMESAIGAKLLQNSDTMKLLDYHLNQYRNATLVDPEGIVIKSHPTSIFYHVIPAMPNIIYNINPFVTRPIWFEYNKPYNLNGF